MIRPATLWDDFSKKVPIPAPKGKIKRSIYFINHAFFSTEEGFNFMDVNPEETKKAVERGTLFGFVPHRLEMAELPQFNNFPFNVLFQSFTVRDGQRISGTALYEPEFNTFRKDGNVSFMRYRNAYGGDCHLTIVYDEEKKLYHGEKYVNGKSVGSAYGGDNWNMFFIHLTMLGLVNGERCMFDYGK